MKKGCYLRVSIFYGHSLCLIGWTMSKFEFFQYVSKVLFTSLWSNIWNPPSRAWFGMFRHRAGQSVDVKHRCIVIDILEHDSNFRISRQWRLRDRIDFVVCEDVEIPHRSAVRRVTIQAASERDLTGMFVYYESTVIRELSRQSVANLWLSLDVGICGPNLNRTMKWVAPINRVTIISENPINWVTKISENACLNKKSWWWRGQEVGDGVGRHGNSVLGMTWNCLVCILSGLFLGICGGTWYGANV